VTFNFYKQSMPDYNAEFFGQHGINQSPIIPASQMLYWLRNGPEGRQPPAHFTSPGNIEEWKRANKWFKQMGQEQVEYEDTTAEDTQLSQEQIEGFAHDINLMTDDILQYLQERSQQEGLTGKQLEQTKKIGMLIESTVRQGLDTLYEIVWDQTGEFDLSSISDVPFTRIKGDNGQFYYRPQGQSPNDHSNNMFMNIKSPSILANISWSKLANMDNIAADLAMSTKDMMGDNNKQLFAPIPENGDKNDIRKWKNKTYTYGVNFLNINDPEFKNFLGNLSSSYNSEPVTAFLSMIKAVRSASMNGNYTERSQKGYEAPEGARGLGKEPQGFQTNDDNYNMMMEQGGEKSPRKSYEKRISQSNWYLKRFG